MPCSVRLARGRHRLTERSTASLSGADRRPGSERVAQFAAVSTGRNAKTCGNTSSPTESAIADRKSSTETSISNTLSILSKILISAAHVCDLCARFRAGGVFMARKARATHFARFAHLARSHFAWARSGNGNPKIPQQNSSRLIPRSTNLPERKAARTRDRASPSCGGDQS